jgi:hypothetical protein
MTMSMTEAQMDAVLNDAQARAAGEFKPRAMADECMQLAAGCELTPDAMPESVGPELVEAYTQLQQRFAALREKWANVRTRQLDLEGKLRERFDVTAYRQLAKISEEKLALLQAELDLRSEVEPLLDRAEAALQAAVHQARKALEEVTLRLCSKLEAVGFPAPAIAAIKSRCLHCGDNADRCGCLQPEKTFLHAHPALIQARQQARDAEASYQNAKFGLRSDPASPWALQNLRVYGIREAIDHALTRAVSLATALTPSKTE